MAVSRWLGMLGLGLLLAACATPRPPSVRTETRHRPPTLEVRSRTPAVYQNPRIRDVAVLGFGSEDFTDAILQTLVSGSRFRMIDRAAIHRILSEQNLQQSDRFDDATAVRIGKLSGVQMVVFGRYESMQCRLKCIDVETGEYLVYQVVDLTRRDVRHSLQNQAHYVLSNVLPFSELYREGASYHWIIGGADAYPDVDSYLARLEEIDPDKAAAARAPVLQYVTVPNQ